MKKLVIEIHGTGVHNRGAELMAIAIAERLRTTFPEAILVVPSMFGSPEEIKQYSFVSHWENTGRYGFIRTGLRMLRTLGREDVINPKDVNIVLDASGFAFSDQWGPWRATMLTNKMNRFYRKTQPLVLLPQALGPFQSPEMISITKKLFSRSSLICARDRTSFNHAQGLAERTKLELYPDFTLGVKAVLPEHLQLPEKFVAIVPNMRMLDKADAAQSYLEFLKAAIPRIKRQGLAPTFLIHDSKEDIKVVELLGEEFSNLAILTHSDPRVLKGILGKATFVIGSRFHALVGALSLGVPCIGAGWSHKYPELFGDFSCSDLLISDLSDVNALAETIDTLSNEAHRAAVAQRISKSSIRLKSQVSKMWTQVEDVIRTASVSRS